MTSGEFIPKNGETPVFIFHFYSLTTLYTINRIFYVFSIVKNDPIWTGVPIYETSILSLPIRNSFVNSLMVHEPRYDLIFMILSNQ